ncbi:MAG TPA: hypothetical protein VGS21_02905 [Acidimicrobiales bacterium]|nr:hypothetical protein [Acidimicrobiales bacterium]
MDDDAPDLPRDPKRLAATYRLPMLMVGDLHARGFERLRAYFMLSPSGLFWRCNVGPSSVAKRDNGGRIEHGYFDTPLVAIYTSGNGSRYYGYDGTLMTSAELADAFARSHSAIMRAAHGEDPAYVAWYRRMLELTEPNRFPYASADFEIPDNRLDWMSVGRADGDVTIPLPPPSLDSGDGAALLKAL